MKVSIKTIKITSVISAISLVIALLMGAEYFKDTSQIYLFGISWVTLQNTAFGIFGSAALAAVSAGIIYGVDKEAYLNKSEQYLIHVYTKSKTAFVQLVQQIATIEGILSDPHSPAITMMSQNPYAYVNVLTDALKNMRACRYEASVLYASDKKLIFDINTIVDDLGMLVEQIHTTITLVTSLRPEWIDYLQKME